MRVDGLDHYNLGFHNETLKSLAILRKALENIIKWQPKPKKAAEIASDALLAAGLATPKLKE